MHLPKPIKLVPNMTSHQKTFNNLQCFCWGREIKKREVNLHKLSPPNPQLRKLWSLEISNAECITMSSGVFYTTDQR